MRKYRWLLYTGLAFILSGILAQILSFNAPIPGILISIGGIIKITFLTLIIRQAGISPGYEMLYLLFGLTFIILGAHLRGSDIHLAYAMTSTILGASLKLLFLFILIKKIRAARIKNSKESRV